MVDREREWGIPVRVVREGGKLDLEGEMISEEQYLAWLRQRLAGTELTVMLLMIANVGLIVTVVHLLRAGASYK